MSQEEQDYGSSEEVEVVINVPDKVLPPPSEFTSTDQELRILRRREAELINERDQILAERNEYRTLYLGVADRHWNTLCKVDELERILGQYQAWFNYNKNWVAHHNRMIQWNPKLGHPDIAGGDPNTPDLSTVVTSEEPE